MSSAEIAERLLLATGTVRNYLSALYRKLGVRRRTDAVRWALGSRPGPEMPARDHDLRG